MATLTLKAQDFCPADNHFTLVATGDVSFQAQYERRAFLAPLTDLEKEPHMIRHLIFAAQEN